MKKILAAALCALLFAAPAFAGSAAVDVRRDDVRGNAAFAPESYPKVWITPVFDDHIITGLNPEKYPARFITFAPPEGCRLTRYAYDESDFLNGDLMGYQYFAYDRASFELFLEDAEAAHIIKDGADGVAVFTEPDSRRARALIDINPQFGGTAKLAIILSDHTGNVAEDSLKDLILAEVERIRSGMKVEEPGHFWSLGAFGSVQIAAGRDPFSAVVDVAGLTVTRIEEGKVVTKAADGNSASAIEIAIGGYSYPHSRMASREASLEDGTGYLRYDTQFTCYGTFTLAEEGKYGPVYLTFKIDCEPGAFDQALRAAYARVALGKAE